MRRSGYFPLSFSLIRKLFFYLDQTTYEMGFAHAGNDYFAAAPDMFDMEVCFRAYRSFQVWPKSRRTQRNPPRVTEARTIKAANAALFAVLEGGVGPRSGT